MFRFLLVACLLWTVSAFAQTGPRLARPPLSATEKLRLRRTPVVDVFERCKGAVVNISTTQVVQVRSASPFDSLFDELFDFPVAPGEEHAVTTTAVGSGFVIHPSGYIVTNAHVVARTAARKAIFPDKSEYDAEIVATDARSDLAVLKIDVDHPLDRIELGNSSDLMIGESVIAIGNPVGLENTVTAGVISALQRKLEVRGEVALNGLIQTDASINPGNSGGPLLNVLGELIGITTAIRGDAQNIGFAIPVDKLVETLPGLLSVERRYRIVAGLDVDPFPGARIREVRPQTPAARAGIRVGDLLCAIDGEPITSGIDYQIALVGRLPGETLRLEVERDGGRLATPITLVDMPKPDGIELAFDKLGLAVEPLTEAVAKKLQLVSARGLLVAKVDPAGPAARVGIEPGDIVVEVGPYAPESMDDVGLLLENVGPGSKIPLGILRVGKRLIYRLRTQIETR